MSLKAPINKRKLNKFYLYHLNKIDLFKSLIKKRLKKSSTLNTKHFYKQDWSVIYGYVLKAGAYEPKFKKKFKLTYNQTFLNKKLFYTYYYNITYYNIRKIAKLSKKKKKFIVSYFLILLESRIDSILLKSHFFSSVYMIRQFILHGHILINNKINYAYGRRLKKNEILSFKSKLKKWLKKIFKYKLYIYKKYNLNYFQFTIPHYLEISYKYFYILFFNSYYFYTNIENIYIPSQINIYQPLHTYKKFQRNMKF